MENRELYFEDLFNILKNIMGTEFNLLTFGSATRYKMIAPDNQENFEMIINRKGHIRKDNLTYIMFSKKNWANDQIGCFW